MGWRRLFVVVTFLALGASASGATREQVRKAIDKSKEWLYKQQVADGTWEIAFEGHGDQKTGQTALVVYALLSAGESYQDKRLDRAIDYLKKTETTGVYALGLRCQIWNLLPRTPDVRSAALRDAKTLAQSMLRSGEGRGLYDYNPGRKAYSHSRAQYAVLGLWAASQMGVEVPKDYWSIVEKAWIDNQDPSGAWAYYAKAQEKFPHTPGMTAAGVATLFITQEFVHADAGVVCKGNISNPAIDRGMKWLTDNFSKVASDEEYARDYPFATLYAIERIGVASGQKYFGAIDWYAKGADWLIRKQKSDGYFVAEYGVKTSGVSFALLFLSRGSSPVIVNKLDYSNATAGQASEGATRVPATADDQPHWNQRPRDAANMARWVGSQIERDLNWQIVNLDSTVDDFHDAPILYLAGNQSLTFTPEHEAKIKQYIEQGGLVLASADCNAAAFANSIKALGKKLFPAYDFAPLPDNHVIFTGQQFQREKWKRKPNVLSMSNGVRELMILLPDTDGGRWWQTQTASVRPEIFELAADIVLYAADKRDFRRRGETYLVKPDAKIKATSTIKVARIEYTGNWDPEPAGWKRLAAIMHNANKVDIVAEPVKPVAGALANYKIAHLTGAADIKLDAAAKAEIKSFIDKGGTLIIDAAGGSTAFTTAIEAELATIFPDAAAQIAEPLPTDHALYNAGPKLTTIGYRNFARTKIGMTKSAQLRGVKVGDRLAVIYSREDLSAGLVGQPVDGIIGYDPATATALMSKTILYANGAKK